MHTGKLCRVVVGLCFFLCFPLTAAGNAVGRVCGRVSDGRSHLPLEQVDVSLTGKELQTRTSPDGHFCLEAVPVGKFSIEFRRPGYALLRSEVELTRDTPLELEAEMEALPTPLEQRVEVVASLLDAGLRNSPSNFILATMDARNLSGVLTQDPLRAVHSLPGVASNDDFESRFSLRGAPFERIGVYLDGALLRLPFHRAASESGGSLSLLNGETLGEITLHSGAPPLAFGDRSAGALVMQTREGRRDRIAGRVTTSASNVSAMAEGPLGRSKRASWLVSFRKSYLEYILKRVAEDSGTLFGYMDGLGRLTVEPSPSLQLDLTVLAASSGLNLDVSPATIDSLTAADGKNRSRLLIFGARYAPSARLLLTPRFVFLREKDVSRNASHSPLSDTNYGEWTGSLSGVWQWSSARTFDFGGSVRRIAERGAFAEDVYGLPRRDVFRGAALHTTAFFQPSFELASGVVNFSAGVRLDRHSVHRTTSISPRLSATVRLNKGTHLRLAWGRYRQHQELRDLFSQFGSTSLPPARSAHLEATLDHNINNSTTLNIGFFNREDRDLLFAPLEEPRLAEGRVFPPQPDAPLESSMRGYARGFQFVLQRRTTTGLSGWASYTYARSRSRNLALHIAFPSNHDQRHTLSLYASYPFRPSVNLSGRWLYGSGFPVSGFFRQEGADFFLDEARNGLRLGVYQRLDVRMNKTFVRPRWRATLFVEAVNLLNQRNVRVDRIRIADPATGQVRLRFQQMFPVLPTVGIQFEF